MKLVETERFKTQKDVSAKERGKAKELLKLYESMTLEKAKSDTTHAHITGIPDTSLKSMSLSADRDGKHVVFGFHNDDVVMLGFIQDSPRIRTRDELFSKNSKAIDLMLVDFMEYQQDHKPDKLASQATRQTNPEAERLLARYTAKSEGRNL